MANISFELLSSVRQEHGDVFARYNRTIQSFFNSSAKVTSAGKRLLEVMRVTDEAIRKIDADLSKISKSRVLQHAQVAIATGVGVLCQFSANPHTRDLGKLLAGGGLIPSALKYFQLGAEKAASLRVRHFIFRGCFTTKPASSPQMTADAVAVDLTDSFSDLLVFRSHNAGSLL
ncbi:MAG TPA: hypothetical protein VFR76_09105 [Verrucomicrobiae bacterium]|nr:hypothetical protein [Verrucomicrobiae bacterium]